MATSFGRETWQVTLPNNWNGRHDEQCTTMTSASDVGALQVSEAFKDFAVVDEDLLDFASEHLDAGAKANLMVAGDFVGFKIAFGDGETFWRQWYLRNGSQMLFVTYNCHHESRGIDDSCVDAILGSLVAINSAPT